MCGKESSDRCCRTKHSRAEMTRPRKWLPVEFIGALAAQALLCPQSRPSSRLSAPSGADIACSVESQYQGFSAQQCWRVHHSISGSVMADRHNTCHIGETACVQRHIKSPVKHAPGCMQCENVHALYIEAARCASSACAAAHAQCTSRFPHVTWALYSTRAVRPDPLTRHAQTPAHSGHSTLRLAPRQARALLRRALCARFCKLERSRQATTAHHSQPTNAAGDGRCYGGADNHGAGAQRLPPRSTNRSPRKPTVATGASASACAHPRRSSSWATALAARARGRRCQ